MRDRDIMSATPFSETVPQMQHTKSMNGGKYLANLARGTRVRLIGTGRHPKRSDQCTVIRVLPNPSNQSEHQWYDVRFDDDSFGRFLEKHLVETRSCPKSSLAWRETCVAGQIVTDSLEDK